MNPFRCCNTSVTNLVLTTTPVEKDCVINYYDNVIIVLQQTRICQGGKLNMCNEDLRNEIRIANVKQWEVADAIGISKMTMVNKNRAGWEY